MILTGKTAIITGGASGIGEAITTMLAREGAHVIINYNKSAARAEALAARLHQEGRHCSVFQADVSLYDEAQALARYALETSGSIDILVNNAGITKDQLLLRMTEADFDSVIATNLKGAWNMAKATTPSMSKARWGRIVNITSVAGLVGNPGQTNYAASKAGMIGLTKSLAREFARRNITVNAVAPGFIETKMTAALPEDLKGRLLEQIPLARYGSPEEVAALVLFLVSDVSAYITGQVINVDGGLVMN